MFQWVYRIGDGVFLNGGPCEVEHDPASQGVVKLSRNPKPFTERYDEKDGIRPATPEEMGELRREQETKRTADEFDRDANFTALVIWLAQKHGVTPATARQEILTIRRTL